MKISFAIILSFLLLPLFAGAAGGPSTITSLTDGFVVTENDNTIPVSITINKGFWENQILKNGGTITAYASSGAGAVSQPILWLAPVLPRNPAGSVKTYGGGGVLGVGGLGRTTPIPL